MFTSLKKWLAQKPFGDTWHKFQKNGIAFFLYGALKAQTLIPAVAGRNGVMGKVLEKNGIKRLFRLYSNHRITSAKMFEFYSNRLLQYTAKVKKLRLVIDWTTLKENFMLLSISLITKRGRTIPIAYDGYKQGELGEGRSQSSIEENLLKKIIETIPMPSRKRITVVADRGFDRPDLAELLISLKVNFVIRVCSGKYITVEGREIEIAKKIIPKGESYDFGNVFYTKSRRVELRFIACWDKKMKDPWFIITNLSSHTVKDILHEYSLRWEIESMFKSKKNAQVGMSWKYAKLTTIDRWLRFVFLITILFQFLADVGIFCDDDISIIKRYTPVANPKRRIFSIYNLALKVIKGLGRIFNIFINQFDELIIRPV